MTEKYILIYLVITFIFSYIVAFYLKKRFPGENEERKLLDEKKLAHFQDTKVQKYFAEAALYKHNRATATLFIFLFNIAIPIVGYLFTLWLSWYLVHKKYEKTVVLTSILDLNELKDIFLKTERIFGESSMINLLNNEYVPKSKKLRALATLASSPSPASLTIIKQTLSSRDDEIRLYGYSILNNMEKKINSKINKNLQLIQRETYKDRQESPELIAEASFELAFSYWELVYMELSHESLKNNFLSSAVQYIETSKEFYHTKTELLAKKLNETKAATYDTKTIRKKELALEQYYEKLSALYTLLGRILLYRGEYEQAQAELTVAKELLPENSTAVIPYLAEIYYNIGKYDITHSILNRYSSLRFNATLYPVIQEWKGEESA
jgi:hypothetical protein